MARMAQSAAKQAQNAKSSIAGAPECHPEQAQNPGREYPDSRDDGLPLDRLDGLPPLPEMRHIFLELYRVIGIDPELDEGARDGSRNNALNIRLGHGRTPHKRLSFSLC
jgi:hypothetical protein